LPSKHISLPVTLGYLEQIGLWDVKGRLPAVRQVPIFPAGEVMCLLEEALPLRALLAPLDVYADKLMAAVEALQPQGVGLCGFGSAMNAVMDYLVRCRLLMLSTACDCAGLAPAELFLTFTCACDGRPMACGQHEPLRAVWTDNAAAAGSQARGRLQPRR
jgi:hypothetical protein